MKRLCLSLLTAALFAAASSSAQETVALYTFPAADYSSSATSLLATASNIANSAGGSITSTGLHYFRNNASNAIPETLEAALANNTFIGFTVTPGNWRLDFRTLAFDFGITNNTSSVPTYTANWALFSSATGFNSTAELIATGSADRAASTGSTAFWITPSPTVNLGAIDALQNAAGAVEFRLYFWDNSATGTSNLILRVDNLAVTVANDPLAITTQPQAQTVFATSTVTLSVATTGSEPITYQWKKDNVDLTNDARISGVNSATLTISDAALADSGSYTVAISNLNNAVTSDAAALTVTPLPSQLPDAPVANAALVVSDIGFLANWNSVTDALNYVVDVSTDANFATFLTGFEALNVGDRLDLAISNLNPSTTYYYRVRAANNVGAGASSNVVTVTTTAPNFPPTITSIADQALAVNRTSGPLQLQFTVGDATTPAADLVVTATSSNPTLVPNTPEALALGGSGAARTLTITPAENKTGTTLITLTVSDGLRQTSMSFGLTVNPGRPEPEFTSLDRTSFTIGLANRFLFTATGTPRPTFSATGLPSWATLNTTTGLLSGTPPAGAATHTITVTASNGISPAGVQTFTLKTQTLPMAVSTLAGSAGQAGSTDATGAAARFNFPLGTATDSAGNAYLADESNHIIRKVTPAGVVTTLAGTAGQSGSADGTGAAARFHSPASVAVDANGNVYVVDTLNHTIRKITAAGEVTTIAGSAGQAGSDNGTGAAARFNAPQDLVLNRGTTPANTGTDLYIADTGNHTIRRLVIATGVVTTLAGAPGQTGTEDGPGTSARFNFPSGIAIDATNRIYVADSANHTIRVVTSTGSVSTLAGTAGTAGAFDGGGVATQFNEPAALRLNASGTTLYVLDTENHTVRQISLADSVVTTLAGTSGTAGAADGTGATARFRFPAGLALNTSGDLFIADTANHTVRLGLPPFAPTIVTQPQSGRSASIGSTIDFTVVATGRPAPTYQWQFNGVDIPGATQSTYTIASVQGENQALGQSGYSVVVTNDLGTVTSARATLTVTLPSQPASEGNNHGGGGAPSLWFFALLAGAAGARWIARRSARR